MLEFLKNITIRKNYFLKLWINKKETYLWKTGWINSYLNKKPVNLEGQAQPWFSLPANAFIEGRLQKKYRIFEFGAGNSSIYFSDMGHHVWSVEHDTYWYTIMRDKQLKNHIIKHASLGTEYTQAPLQYTETFDIVVIDGRKRLLCLDAAIKKVSANGIIIFDDIDRKKYQPAYALLQSHGFRHIDFWGMALGSFRTKCTAIFYRKDNVFAI